MAAGQEGTSAIVTLADGTSVPLRPWTFSYEYVAYPKGTSPALAPVARREARALWAGKRAFDDRRPHPRDSATRPSSGSGRWTGR